MHTWAQPMQPMDSVITAWWYNNLGWCLIVQSISNINERIGVQLYKVGTVQVFFKIRV